MTKMNRKSFLLTALGVVCAIPASADLPTADQVIAKCLDNYDALKTYQGTLSIHMQQGNKQSKMTLKVKAENGKNGMIARSTMTMNVTAIEPTGTTSSTIQLIDDGKTIFAVRADLKQYSEQPHGPDKISGLFRQTLDNVKKFGGKLSVSIDRLQNRPVYKISSTFAEGKVEIYIDKETYHFQSLHGTREHAGIKTVVEMTASDQVFNQPIPATAFTWSPQPGYKKVTAKDK